MLALSLLDSLAGEATQQSLSTGDAQRIILVAAALRVVFAPSTIKDTRTYASLIIKYLHVGSSTKHHGCPH